MNGETLAVIFCLSVTIVIGIIALRTINENDKLKDVLVNNHKLREQNLDCANNVAKALQININKEQVIKQLEKENFDLKVENEILKEELDKLRLPKRPVGRPIKNVVIEQNKKDI